VIKLTPQRAMAIMEADQAIAWARITSHMEIQRMSKHSKPYAEIDYARQADIRAMEFAPEPLEQDEPSNLMFWLYVACTFVAGCALLVVLMGWPV
jgi:hypothetical protein